MYKLQKDELGVIRLSDMAFIPANEMNRDWREYLEWVSLGNTPSPAYTSEELALLEEEKEKLKIEERTRKFRDKGDVVSEDISTTTSTTLQTKTVYQFTPKETSDYVLLWTLEMANSNANGASYYQVDVNDQTVIGDGIYRPSAANYWMTISGHSIQSLTKDVTYTYKIKYRAGSNTAKIRRAKLYIVEDR